MTVGTFGLTTYSASTSSTAAFDYKTQIDQNFLVMQRFGQSFAPHEQSTGDLTIKVDAGWIWDGRTTLTEVAAQNTSAFASPAASPRIDRVVISPLTGAASIVSGTAAQTPSKPDIPAGYVPICSVYLSVGVSRVGNSMITDERVVWGDDLPGDYQEFTSTAGGSWGKPLGFSSNSLVRAMVFGAGGGGSTDKQGGGGGGGACFYGECRLGDLSTAVAVTVGAGGSCTASTDGQAQVGGNSGFGSSWIGYGGGGGWSGLGCFIGGSGGGWWTSGLFLTGTTRGAPLPGPTSGTYSIFGGNQIAASTSAAGMGSVWGGGAGGWFGFPSGSMYGGGGGGAGSTLQQYTGAPSFLAGSGGAGSTAAAGGVAGTAPSGGGGGGGNTGVGARGEVRVWVLRG